MSVLEIGIKAVEKGLVPDTVTRMAIRRLCKERLRGFIEPACDNSDSIFKSSRAAFIESMRSAPIALLPDKANQQHYELPPEFFAAVLGPRRKYSCCYFPSDNSTLSEAEEAALEATCRHAELADGQEILELGCGWGSLSLWMAVKFPHSQIVAVSNSRSQRQFIEAAADSRGLRNLSVVTADMNEFSPGKRTFDRVVSVEMFEHMRNYDLLLGRIATWLRSQGRLFVHIFCHRSQAYPFETGGAANWMGRHFFSGGMMPSADLFQHFDRALTVAERYVWNGRHYQQTAEAWLANLDARRDEVLRICGKVYGSDQAPRWLNRWRTFFIAVSELFGFAGGDEWHVGHFLMEPTDGEVTCLR